MYKESSTKKIAFILTSFVVGGVEQSFLDLMDAIDTSQYEITVFLPDSSGEWTKKLSDMCSVRYLRIEDIKTILNNQLKTHQWGNAVRSIFCRLVASVLRKHNYRKSYEWFIKSMPGVSEVFDCVVAYQIINDDCVLNALYRVHAPVKILWSHAYINKTESIYGEWYNRFDKVFCVSDFARKALLQNFPFLEPKVDIIHNIINADRIHRMALEPADSSFHTDETSILTVGRLSHEKGQEIIPLVVEELISRGVTFTWYLIGDGPTRPLIEKQIQDKNLQAHLVVLGNMDNPYPYIRSCDLYVQTSVNEGWGLTVSEAKILSRPIITTDAGVMREQIRHGINGWIVEKNSPSDIADAVQKLIESPEIRNRFTVALEGDTGIERNEFGKLFDMI